MKLTVFVCLLTVALPVTVFGDTIYVKSGKVLEGKVLEEDPDPMASGGHSMYPLAEGHVYIVGTNGGMQQIPKADIVRVEKQIRPPHGVALLAKVGQWGAEKHGYQTQLVATSKEFVLVAGEFRGQDRAIAGISIGVNCPRNSPEFPRNSPGIPPQARV